MNEDSFEKEVAILAQNLWHMGTRSLHWSSAPLSQEQPWVESWADVYVPELCEPLEANWLITIAAPEDEVEEEEAYFQIEPDASLLIEFRDGDLPTQMTFFSPGEEPLDIPLSEVDTTDKDALQQNEFYWSAYKQERFLEKDALYPTYRRPVWSKGLIARVVSDWLEVISGHRFLMHFDETIQSPVHLQVAEIIEDMKSGKTETFDLGDGLRVSGQAFDFFLADPELAAEITTEIKKLVPPEKDSEDRED